MKPINTLQGWLDYIVTIHTSRIDLNLQRIQVIAEEQKLNQFPCPVVMVGGTNGKGSCVRCLESIYLSADYRVGTYSSPHLLHFNERIQVNGQPIDDDRLITAFEAIENYRGDRSLSFFEYTTLAAFDIFQQSELDILLLEVGLGGRLDAVNVVEPDVSIVTTISLDHQAQLGDTREKIALEKAGIFRSHKPAICGDKNPPNTLFDYAKQIEAHYLPYKQSYFYEEKPQTWDWHGPNRRYEDLPKPRLKFQNAAAALMAVESLQLQRPVTEAAIRLGLKRAQLPGRFERYSGKFHLILDVAHNSESAEWLKEQIQALSLVGEKKAVFGMRDDKDLDDTLRHFLPIIDAWYLAPLSLDASHSPEKIAHFLRANKVKNCYNYASISEALDQATQSCFDSEDCVIVFGSFHTVAEAKQKLEELGNGN